VEAEKGKIARFLMSLSIFEAPVEIFFGHLIEGRGGVRISGLRYWHAFDFSVLRAQYLRKGKELFLWLS
jgi:hypothetical protein